MGYTHFPQQHKTTSPADVLYYKVFSSLLSRSPVLITNYTKNDSKGSALWISWVLFQPRMVTSWTNLNLECDTDTVLYTG